MNLTKIGEHDQKIDNNELIFGHIQPLIFVLLVTLFYLNISGQIHPYFGQVQRITRSFSPTSQQINTSKKKKDFKNSL